MSRQVFKDYLDSLQEKLKKHVWDPQEWTYFVIALTTVWITMSIEVSPREPEPNWSSLKNSDKEESSDLSDLFNPDHKRPNTSFYKDEENPVTTPMDVVQAQTYSNFYKLYVSDFAPPKNTGIFQLFRSGSAGCTPLSAVDFHFLLCNIFAAELLPGEYSELRLRLLTNASVPLTSTKIDELFDVLNLFFQQLEIVQTTTTDVKTAARIYPFETVRSYLLNSSSEGYPSHVSLSCFSVLRELYPHLPLSELSLSNPTIVNDKSRLQENLTKLELLRQCPKISKDFFEFALFMFWLNRRYVFRDSLAGRTKGAWINTIYTNFHNCVPKKYYLEPTLYYQLIDTLFPKTNFTLIVSPSLKREIMICEKVQLRREGLLPTEVKMPILPSNSITRNQKPHVLELAMDSWQFAYSFEKANAGLKPEELLDRFLRDFSVITESTDFTYTLEQFGETKKTLLEPFCSQLKLDRGDQYSLTVKNTPLAAFLRVE